MIIPVLFSDTLPCAFGYWKEEKPGSQSEMSDLAIISTCLVSYLSKLPGLGLLTRRLCSRLIGSHTSNITTIILEQIAKRFLCNNLSRLMVPPMYRSSELLFFSFIHLSSLIQDRSLMNCLQLISCKIIPNH